MSINLVDDVVVSLLFCLPSLGCGHPLFERQGKTKSLLGKVSCKCSIVGSGDNLLSHTILLPPNREALPPLITDSLSFATRGEEEEEKKALQAVEGLACRQYKHVCTMYVMIFLLASCLSQFP